MKNKMYFYLYFWILKSFQKQLLYNLSKILTK